MYGQLKRKAMLELTSIITGQDNTTELEKINQHLYGMAKPREYTGAGGAEVSYTKSYEEMSLILGKYMGRDAKKATVREYYQAFTALKKENKARLKQKPK